MGLPRVALILVNWNGAAFVRPCLESIRALDYDSDRVDVLLVDNGSSDESLDIVRREFPDVRVLINDRNNYARANNLGVEQAQSSPYVVLLNNDTEVDQGWLRALVTLMEKEPKAAAVGSKIVFQDGRLNSTGIEALDHFHWRDRGFGEADCGQYDHVDEVEGLSGCSVIYRRDVFREMGGLDEDFEMYYEDVEFSMRLRDAGHSLLYCPQSRVVHRYNASISQLDEGGAKDRFGERNRLFIVARYFADNLPSMVTTSRFLFDAPVREIRSFLPVLKRKWLKSDRSASAEADRLDDWILGTKLQILRLQKSAKASARSLDHALTEKKMAVAEMDEQVEYHRRLLMNTEERLMREQKEARREFDQVLEQIESERGEARAAFQEEQNERREREKWIGFLLQELKRHRKLQDSEIQFLESQRLLETQPEDDS